MSGASGKLVGSKTEGRIGVCPLEDMGQWRIGEDRGQSVNSGILRGER